MFICQSYHPPDNLRLEAGNAVVDSGHLVRAVRVHGGLELSLDQAWIKNIDEACDSFLFSSLRTWRYSAHTNVAPDVPELLSPSLQEASHSKLGGSVKPVILISDYMS